MKNKHSFLKLLIFIFIFLFIALIFVKNIFAASIFPSVDISIGGSSSSDGVATSVQLIVLFTILTLVPYILIMLTSFTRIVISLSFLRNAIGTQTIPSNQIIIGLALFMTFFIMSPIFDEISKNAFTPYANGEISQEVFIEEAVNPLRTFMMSQVEEKDLLLFTNLAGIESYDSPESIPNSVLIPAFILGEVTKGFKIGFILYIPFIVIDMVVSSVLMAMGMMMLAPALISAPFKILLFIMVDGWSLIVENIVRTFS